MPSRFGILAILVFWLATSAFVGYREIWPRLMAGGPPPIRIDLTDEATQQAPSLWSVYRGDQKIGGLTTRMEYVPEDDSFRFRNNYRDLTFDFNSIRMTVPGLETLVRVSRDGQLRDQRMKGTVKVLLQEPLLKQYVLIGGADAEVDATVVNNQLVGTVSITKAGLIGDLKRDLDPVPVTAGQVLNPMMPVNRLSGVQPGRRWVIREVNPLGQALSALGKEMMKSSNVAAGAFPTSDSRELLAEVRSEPETVTRRLDAPVECWVIEYRQEQEVLARTWVSVADGRVMRQQAESLGERLRFERED